MRSFLITGSSRGLGLAFARKLLENPENIVIATARNTAGSSGLQQLAKQYPSDRLVLLDLDVEKTESIRNAVEEVDKRLPDGLDNLISNAGTLKESEGWLSQVDLDKMKEDLAFVTTHLDVIRQFLPLIRRGKDKKIAVISSFLGSIDRAINLVGLMIPYSASKAALNMAVRKVTPELKMEGITIFAIHPGWVGATEIGSAITEWVHKNYPETREFTEDEAAEAVVKALDTTTLEDAGKFFDNNGTTLPW
ncbi:hypothetical protein VTK73DRAFT_6693 [Phialemonium thermophilum]|uniref:Short-chain dehydrogenase n=1 Tax=Phialemonium thermophilum TaxID=223376 RepID=A0ABR3WI95_9PEZI